jgi:hypothetical protein
MHLRLPPLRDCLLSALLVTLTSTTATLTNTPQTHCYLLFMEYSRKVTPLRHYPIPKYTLRILPKTDLFLFQPQNKILTQNPLEYRAVAETAVAVGARPQDLGFEAEQGGDFCLRLMG